MKELQYLNKYFYKYKYHFIGGILIAIVARIFALYTPKLVGNSMSVVEDFIKGNIDRSQADSVFLKNLLLIVAFTIIAGFFLFLTRQTLIVVSRHIEFDLKNEIFTHYENLSQSFFKQNRTGDLMSRISSDVDKVRQYIGPSIMYGISTAITFVVVIAQMYIISPTLTLYTLIPLPLLSYSIFKLSNEINKKSTAYQQNLSSLATFTQEMFSGIRVIKAHNLEKNIQGDFQELSKESKVKNMRLAKMNAMFGPLMMFLIGISSLIVIFVGGMMYIDGKITHIGVIAEFILYVNMLIWPVASLGWISSMVQEAEASQKRINEFLKTVPDIQNKSDEPVEIQGTIEFKNVSFTYDDTNIQALKNVSFSVKKGETIAIFGKTGSGKSTILSLVSRLYDVKEGEILIDGVPIDQINLEGLRKNMAVVPQDAFLFSDTIKNNIRFGNQEASDNEIIEVARLAAVHDNIAGFANGYETILGERGISLSGGQKQRVSIARALLKDAKILLLDDCLSAVDTETEETILSNLGKVMENKTTFIVSHRVSAARNADKIIVLDEGKIIEQGSHNELISQNGYYKELYEMQLSEKELS
jgi:ATP-binding cassette subfamily B multidrug efflux pump